MWFIPWIQTSSAFIKNSKWPADWKMSLSTANRLALTFVQRKKWMICYDEDLDVWKKLINDPAWDTTTDSDWIDFNVWQEPIDITYANLRILRDNGNLVMWAWYRIIDFVSKNLADDDGTVYTGTVEPIYVQATFVDTISRYCYSETHFDDELKYDFDDNLITSYTYWYWDSASWGDQWYNTTIRNLTATSFEINKEYDFSKTYYLYIDDSNKNSDEFDNVWYWTDFTQTDVWGGWFRIDFIAPINTDLLDSWATVRIEWEWASDTRPWRIIYRKNTERNIEANFDFMNYGRKRYKADVSTYPAWDSWTTYIYKDIVTYNWDLYMAMDETTWDAPQSSSKIWFQIIRDYNSSYMLTAQNISLHSKNIVHDLHTWEVFNTFNKYNYLNWTHTFDISQISNVKLLSDDVVCIVDTNEISWLKVWLNCEQISVLWYVSSIDIRDNSFGIYFNMNSNTNNNVILSTLYNAIFTNTNWYNTINKASSIWYGWCSYTKFWHNHINCFYSNCNTTTFWAWYSYFRVWYWYKSTLGNAGFFSYFKQTRNDVLDWNINYVLQRSTNFNDNEFGTYFQNLIVPDWTYFYKNKIGSYFGWNTAWNKFTIPWTFAENTGGNVLFANAVSTRWSLTFSTFKSDIHKLYYGTGNVAYCVYGNNVFDIYASHSSYMTYNNYAHAITYNIWNTWEFGTNTAWLTFNWSVVRSFEVAPWVQSISTWVNTDNLLSSFNMKKIISWEWSTNWIEYIDSIGNTLRDDPTT